MGLQEQACGMAKEIYDASIPVLDALILISDVRTAPMLAKMAVAATLTDKDRRKFIGKMKTLPKPSLLSSLEELDRVNCPYLKKLLGISEFKNLAKDLTALRNQIANLPFSVKKQLFDSAKSLMSAAIADAGLAVQQEIFEASHDYLSWLKENGIIDLIMGMIDAEACLLSLCGESQESYMIEFEGEQVLRSVYYADKFFVDRTNGMVNIDRAMNKLATDIIGFVKPSVKVIDDLFICSELLDTRITELEELYYNGVQPLSVNSFIPKNIQNFFDRIPGESSISRYAQMNVPDIHGNLKPNLKALLKTPEIDIIAKLKKSFSITFKYRKIVAFGKTILIPTLVKKSVVEPSPTSSKSQYGKVQVTETKGGHVSLIDNTEGNKRILQQHPSGTYVSMIDNGSHILKTTGDMITISQKNWNINILGDKVEINQGDTFVTIKKDNNVSINADNTITIDGESVEKVGKDWTVTVGGNINLAAEGNMNLSVKGNVNMVTTGNVDAKVTGNMKAVMGGNADIIATQLNLTGLGKISFTAPMISMTGATKVSIMGALIELQGALIKEN